MSQMNKYYALPQKISHTDKAASDIQGVMTFVAFMVLLFSIYLIGKWLLGFSMRVAESLPESSLFYALGV